MQDCRLSLGFLQIGKAKLGVGTAMVTMVRFVLFIPCIVDKQFATLNQKMHNVIL
jgi:hypothetical protein